ncbi:MAG: hypothetical protein JOZ33_06205 [Acidobacteriaceae bacterium]|nr:hypothetical protein [Acidobacteriaceae bacterium]
MSQTVNCATHGESFETFVCEHLAANPSQRWYSSAPSVENPWPDAWCHICNHYFEEQGEWNDANSHHIKAELLCHNCYQTFREGATTKPV